MGKYSVPENIRQLKPKGTMVKAISGNYYVYQYSCVMKDGKRTTKMGKCIGSIKEGIGFVSNNKHICDENISVLEYGQYAAAYYCSQDVLEDLKKFFNAEDAVMIYVMGLIHFVNGFCYLKDMKQYFDMSWLSIRYPSLKMGYEVLSNLYDALGRRQEKVFEMEQYLTNKADTVAVDGHVIGSGSWCNDLASKGYKFNQIKEKQMNMLMAYDIKSGSPVAVRVTEGGMQDKTSVQELFADVTFSNKLILADRGFYSKTNLELFSASSNRYIIPVPNNIKECKEAVKDLTYKDIFVHEGNGKLTTVDWKVDTYPTYKVFVFRDKDEWAKEATNYLLEVKSGKESYTMEKYEQIKDFFGVYVLRTNDMTMEAEDVFAWYKKRWCIETFYNYFKNDADCSAFYQHDYCKIQGLSFVLMISSLIHSSVQKKILELKKTTSVKDMILNARLVKIHKRKDSWVCTNCKSKVQEMLELLNVPLSLS